MDSNNNTCAHFVARNGNDELLKYLMDCGFKLFHIREKSYQMTALHFSILMKHVGITEILVREADQETINECLILSAKEGNVNSLEVLLRHKAQINYLDKQFQMPALYWACLYQHVSSAQFLFEQGAKLMYKEKRNLNSGSLLYIAVNHSNNKLVELLLSNEIELNDNSENPQQNSALFLASQNGNLEIAKVLIQNGANLNYANEMGETPLIVATMKNWSGIVSLLLKYGAQTLCKDKKGKIALDYATQKEIIELLNNQK